MRHPSGNTRYLVTSAALLLLLSCGGGDLTLPGETSPPSDLLLVSGNDQAAKPGNELPAPLVVKVVDAQGNPVANSAVSWTVGAGGGSVSPGAAQTDSGGLALATLTLGADEGTNTVSAAVTGLEAVTFTASAQNGGGGDGGGGGGGPVFPYRLEIMLQPTVAFAGQRFTPPVVVAVVDENGNVVRDYKTKIQVVLAAGSGELDGKLEHDTKEGTATFDDLRIDEVGLGKVLRAQVSNDPTVGPAESDPFAVLGWDDHDD
jgi:Big-like domain-containing protein